MTRDKRDKKYHTRVNFEMTFDPQIRTNKNITRI